MLNRVLNSTKTELDRILLIKRMEKILNHPKTEDSERELTIEFLKFQTDQ